MSPSLLETPAQPFHIFSMIPGALSLCVQYGSRYFQHLLSPCLQNHPPVEKFFFKKRKPYLQPPFSLDDDTVDPPLANRISESLYLGINLCGVDLIKTESLWKKMLF